MKTQNSWKNIKKKSCLRGEIFEKILFDNGIEFNDTKGMMSSAKLKGGERFRAYYAHTYSSYERGCNENKNRELRRFIPKGKNIEELTEEYLQYVMKKINNKPRKRLGYKSALEVYEEELKKVNEDTEFLEKYKEEKNYWYKNKKIS